MEKRREISTQKWEKNSVSYAIMEEWFRLKYIWETKRDMPGLHGISTIGTT